MADFNAEEQFLTLHEFVKKAKLKLSPFVWDYLFGGSETETTLKRNRMALDSIAFRPRVLRDVTDVDTSRTVWGRNLRLPVVMAPMGGLQHFDPDGGSAVSRAAERLDIPFMVGSNTQPGLANIAKAAPDAELYYQLYVMGDHDWIAERIKVAEDSGYKAFCLTVDSNLGSRRERDIAKRYIKPWHTNNHYDYRPRITWETVDFIKKTCKLPLILKGIASAEDSALAVEHGADVVYISNHGGRQPDHTRGSMEVLPEAIEAVGGKAKVWIDGGFVRGTDVIKAIALGAEMVGIGRLQGYALAAAGEDGVVRAMEILQQEIVIALGLLGVTSFDQLDTSYLFMNAPVVNQPHQLSAFPLLDLEDAGY
jgi:isopentenyl diphosphate isomerase/L-lactate dehydrogenase-like FMN-dependent dehydrogenase